MLHGLALQASCAPTSDSRRPPPGSPAAQALAEKSPSPKEGFQKGDPKNVVLEAISK